MDRPLSRLISDPMLLIKTMRVHQWVKNLLLFVPFLLAYNEFDLSRLWELILAFFTFSFCASANYIFNDISDLESDRRHPTKRNRPLAAGKISVLHALYLSVLLLVSSFAMAWFLPHEFQIILAAYLSITLAYSYVLKSLVLVDVMVLGFLYTIRILAGIYAAQVSVSYWILVFSMFLFVSLAMLKRFAELYNLQSRNETQVSGRGYFTGDLHLVSSLGSAAGYISTLILLLYSHDPISVAKYSHPEWLWMAFPALLYWVSYMWLIAHRGRMDEDPVLFAIRDKKSYAVGVVCLLSFILAA